MRRDPQSSTKPTPSLTLKPLSHTGGTYSRNGKIGYPRFPISDMHLGWFPDSVDFQSWKVNFMTAVCSKTADPHLTMHWIKEVETATSIDELVTSQSILGRTDSTDYDMLDAMIASALLKESKCRRATCSKIRPILTSEANCKHLWAFSGQGAYGAA